MQLNRISNVHLYKHGIATPLITQRADPTQMGVDLTLSDVETFYQGSYSCQYSVTRGYPPQQVSSSPSNTINITVGESLPVLYSKC